MKSDIGKLIEEIIPPADYNHRNGFNNTPIIDKLDVETKLLVEDVLINKLLDGDRDTLIVETLAYLKSTKSLPVLYTLLESETNATSKLIVAVSIFELNHDDDIIDLAIREFNKMEHWTAIIHAFYYLSKFDNPKTNNIIGSYVNDKDYLISYNAKRFWKP